LPEDNEFVFAVRKGLDRRCEWLHRQLGQGNESSRTKFIDSIVGETILTFKLSNIIRVETQRTLSGEETQGKVEFVFSANVRPRIPMILLIQAKKGDFDQGRAQCYMELHNATQMNIKRNENYDFPLYGIITNSLTWIFVKYDPKVYEERITPQKQGLFVESTSISIDDDEGLKKMLQFLVGILKEQEKKIFDLKIKFSE
jgi:hypothetical protein